jgi:multidrug efflux pump
LGPWSTTHSGTSALSSTVTGDGASYAQLKDVAEAFRKRLQRVPDVTKVDLYGDQPERVFVEFSHAKLATLSASLQFLFDSIAKQNALVPAGEFQTDAQRMPVRVTGAQQAADAVAETPVFAGGQTFRLGDVANVYHGYQDPPSFLIRAQGQPALEVGVVVRKGGNILALGKTLDAAAGRLRPVASPLARVEERTRSRSEHGLRFAGRVGGAGGVVAVTRSRAAVWLWSEV